LLFGERSQESCRGHSCNGEKKAVIRLAYSSGSAVAESVDISKWLVEGQPVATQSKVMLY
jgi:hypothetical protein